jgi:hypothetical protein
MRFGKRLIAMQIVSAWDAPSPALKFEDMVPHWVSFALAKHVSEKPRIFSSIGALERRGRQLSFFVSQILFPFGVWTQILLQGLLPRGRYKSGCLPGCNMHCLKSSSEPNEVYNVSINSSRMSKNSGNAPRTESDWINSFRSQASEAIFSRRSGAWRGGF